MSYGKLDYMSMYVRVERHSISPENKELVSFVVCYPRCILPEILTHGALSRNTSSSRAIPYRYKGTRKPGQPPSMRDMVMENPYTPVDWGIAQTGMQSSNTRMKDFEIRECKARILEMRDKVVALCDEMWALGMAKQNINRYLEPWAWTTQIISGTEWANFFALRTHPSAHPVFQFLAKKMYVAYKRSVPQRLDVGQLHLPFTDTEDYNNFKNSELLKLSVARCARISYNTFDGIRSPEKDFELYEKLCGANPKHMSTFGHQARVPGYFEKVPPSNFKGWVQYRKLISGENITEFSISDEELAAWERLEWQDI